MEAQAYSLDAQEPMRFVLACQASIVENVKNVIYLKYIYFILSTVQMY